MQRNRIFLVCSLLLLFTLLSCSESFDPDDPFYKSELKWRKERDERMRKPTSWLTIAGLFWLEKGSNSFGSGEENDILLLSPSAPQYMGTIELKENILFLKVNPGISLSIDGKLIREKQLVTDVSGKPDILEIGDIKFWIIKRGDRYALRLRDMKSKRFAEYHGIDYYPMQKDYSVKAKLVPYDKPKTAIILTVVGTEQEYIIPGYLEFTLRGKSLRLDPFVVKSDSTLFFLIIKDGTSGETTYGAGRYMYSKIMADGSVDLNFNRAYNPPCAFTPYATCPLPPEQNIMNVSLEAGEKNYHKDH